MRKIGPYLAMGGILCSLAAVGLMMSVLKTAQAAEPEVHTGAATDKGVTRDHNEDSFGVFDVARVYVVADGMGGHAAGEVASRMAVDTLWDFVRQPTWGLLDRVWPEARTNIILAAYREANRRILSDSMNTPEHRGMGTTMVSAVVRRGYVDVINLGDSRAYRYRKGKIEQVTRDHSLVQELIDSGKLKTEEEIARFPYKNIITRAMGTQPTVEADVFCEPIERGDIYILCSDGLTNEVTDAEIAGVLDRYGRDFDGAAKSLVERANAHGGRDNISVVLVGL